MSRLSNKSSLQSLQRGFTIVELLVVITVMSILTAILFGSLDDLLTSNYRTVGTTTQVGDTRTALRQVQTDLMESDGFLKTPSVADATGPPTGTWLFSGLDSTHRYLIASTYATTHSSDDPNRSLVYVANALGVCDSVVTQNTPLKNNLIYYVKDGVLYRRTIVASASMAPRCGGTAPYQKQTCAPGGPTNARCQGTDAVVLRNVTKFEIDYYATPEANTPINVYTDPNLFSTSISTISIKITTNQKINGKDNAYTATLRMSHQ